MTITYHVGDTRDVVATIPDGSVSLVACSPPFIALRSYLPADHPDKHAEIGSEPDPATFLATLLGLTAEWCRVLAPWGSIAIELGDTYASSGTSESGWHRSGAEDVDRYRSLGAAFNAKANGGNGWPRPKCLALVPQLYAASLAYGRNLLTGEPCSQMLVRNMVVWHRPNPAVGALGDKYRPSTSYITVATKSPRRWFDLTAVRSTPTIDPAKMWPGSPSHGAARQSAGLSPFGTGVGGNPAGAPPLDAWFDQHDTWTITTQPSRLAHYAMWPPRLAERLILSMCPREVCSVCGEPRRRVEKASDEYQSLLAGNNGGKGRKMAITDALVNPMGGTFPKGGERRQIETLGWTDCGHDAFVPGVVLDPFAGTGTTLAVADLHGRDAIGIDIDERNRDLMPARMEEVRRTLFGTIPELPGQIDLFGGAA